MAKSPAHRWGQIIGDVVEEAFRPLMAKVAERHNLYFDFKRERAARPALTVAWTDVRGNSHLLDYVLERNGTETKRGLPVAFVETAFRRYTKHSKNKAQEIEGAVLSLAETYSHIHPFCGAILAGVFTSNSLTQLRSRGFEIIYVPHTDVERAFREVGIDASCTEDTPDSEFADKVDKWERLDANSKERVRSALVRLTDYADFIKALDTRLSRQVESVRVTAFHGVPCDVSSVADAIHYIETYKDPPASVKGVLKFEVEIRFSNGDSIGGVFQDRADALGYLAKFV